MSRYVINGLASERWLIQFDALQPEDHKARTMPVQLFLKKAIRNLGKDISYRTKVFESCYLHPCKGEAKGALSSK